MKHRDLMVLAVLLALCLVGVVTLTALGDEVPGILENVAAALVGAVTAVALPARKSTP